MNIGTFGAGGQVAEIDGGTIESLWVSDRLGRPVIKAFNAVLASPFVDGAQPRGTAGRIAIPIGLPAPRDNQ